MRTPRDVARALRLRIAAAIAALALLLVGCAGQPGAAAIVDGAAISEATLAETVADVSLLAPSLEARRVLEVLVVGPFWLAAAADAGFGTSTNEGLAYVEMLAERAGVDPDADGFGPGIVLIGQMSAAQEKAAAQGQGAVLEEEAFARVARATVEISPRYGQWAARAIAPSAWPWLVGGPGQGP